LTERGSGERPRRVDKQEEEEEEEEERERERERSLLTIK
jgi:hypothetical protein